ncbi:ETS-related transcription factor Elf-2a isoform X2 [Rhincodon typus]|uniref:ETS-related transcription factor Elf-2a isoform X2 n=1 Tax=Rhincodon typus TaxID=259920 RepID=UPI0009A44DDC|nr:ETS-related transcription factor Elf-2a isoform X2 [Rhincodon typus]
MTSAVVETGGLVFDFASNGMETHQQQEAEKGPGYPAVIVEPVPSARLDQGYAAQILVYNDETYLMQDVAEEQEIETDSSETVEASVHSSHVHCTDKTIEAAEALLHMDSSTSLRDDKNSVQVFVPPCVSTPEFVHAAMRPDVITETVVEVSTEEPEPMDTSPALPILETPEPTKKKKAGRKPKNQQSELPNSPSELSVKKKAREGKGNTTYLWEFLLDLLQDKNTCPRYIKWTQREKGIFKLVDSKAVSKLWGKHKNKPDMNYETMGRALRYYYQRGILAKVEGQRLVYQFKEMPKNLVIIDEDKTDPSAGSYPSEIRTDETGNLSEVMSPSSENITSPISSKVMAVSRGARHTAQQSVVKLGRATTVKVSSSGHGGVLSQVPPTSLPVVTTTVPSSRAVCVAMQVPVVMTSSGQKFSTVAVQSMNPVSTVITSTNTTISTPKVLIQTIPTMVPATTVENGDKITMQPAKIITIPATQITQCHLQTKSGLATAGSINIVGAQAAIRALSPMSIAGGTPVMRLAVPAQQSTVQNPARVITAVIKGAEVKPESTATKVGADLHNLPVIKEERSVEGSKTVTRWVVVSAPSAIAVPLTMKTEAEATVTGEK